MFSPLNITFLLQQMIVLNHKLSLFSNLHHKISAYINCKNTNHFQT